MNVKISDGVNHIDVNVDIVIQAIMGKANRLERAARIAIDHCDMVIESVIDDPDNFSREALWGVIKNIKAELAKGVKS
jgi:hypothetical protein